MWCTDFKFGRNVQDACLERKVNLGHLASAVAKYSSDLPAIIFYGCGPTTVFCIMGFPLNFILVYHKDTATDCTEGTNNSEASTGSKH